MKAQVRRIVLERVRIFQEQNGFKAIVRGQTLDFKKISERQFEVYYGDEKCAYFNCLGKHLTVLKPSGEIIMHVNEKALEEMDDEGYCGLVADMVARMQSE